jgi:hypothetical protein
MQAKSFAIFLLLMVSTTLFAADGAVSTLPRPIGELDTRLMSEYGAVQMARSGVVLPPGAMFESEADVADWQSSVPVSRGILTLQTAAAEALSAAQAEAVRHGLKISPRAADSAARSYKDTLDLWRSRIEPGLDHWVSLGRLNKEEAERVRSLPVRRQVVAILELESEGMYFSRDFSKSILSSVAPPGASQHLALLAFDVKEHADARIRAILERHGWFQTVAYDCPHFTYLGVEKSQLPLLGLMKVVEGDRQYWVPQHSELAVKIANR